MSAPTDAIGTTDGGILVMRHSPVTPRPAGPIVLLDRDGTIIENRDAYVLEHSHVHLLPASVPALKLATGAGCRLFVVSNQSAIGRGVLSRSTASEIHRRLVGSLCEQGVIIEASFICPHAPADACSCRKPLPGLLLEALGYAGGLPSAAAFVGDAPEDILAARAAGVPDPILVRTGRGRAAEAVLGGTDDLTVVDDLGSAVEHILKSSSASLDSPPGDDQSEHGATR